MNKPELLAPAGDYSCFQAAIRAGADAVYLGGQQYGARAFAGNFTQEELLRALDEAHFYGKKIYLTINTLMKQEELDRLPEFVSPFYQAGLDGVIVQDVGALCVLRRNFPNLPLHASTQMTITDADGANALKELGIVRVVPARELSLAEIETLKQDSGLEVETFIHGAMCYCYSGQCLFSSFLGGRSGNRGRCAQPCRQPYQIMQDLGQLSRECYPLSLKDMCTLPFIPDLIDAGIDSFKIEGRMKKPEYVAGVTSVYRRRIDEYLKNPGKKRPVRESDMKLLGSLYIRSSVSGGYYDRHNGKEMITLDQPGYAGNDESLLNRIRTEIIEKELSLPIQMYAVLMQDQPLILTACLVEEDGSISESVTLEGNIVQPAQKRPLAQEDVEKQLRKVGGTGFCLDSLLVEMDENIFLPVRELNELRRNVLDELKRRIISKNMPYEPVLGEDSGEPDPFRSVEGDLAGRVSDFREKNGQDTVSLRKLHTSVSTAEQLQACLDSGADRIYIPYTLGTKARECRSKYPDVEFFLTMPVIMRQEKNSGTQPMFVYENLLADGVFDGVQISSPSALTWLKRFGWQGRIAFDHRMYIWNQETWNFWNPRMDTYCAPLELNRRDLFRLPAQNREMLVYGHIPLMVTANCIRKTSGQCLKQSTGKKGAAELALLDRYQTVFPVRTDCRFCYNIIYNSVPLSLHNYMDEILENGNRMIRMDFLAESAPRTAELIRAFSAGKIPGKKTGGVFEENSELFSGGNMERFFEENSFTSGHYKKGAQ